MLHIIQAAVHFDSLGLHPEIFTIAPFHIGGTELGPFSLRWYSLSYIGGILIAWWLMTRMIRRSLSPINAEQIDSFITWATLGIILGGRLGYVLFYNREQYLAHPLDVFRLWDGGMASHGGMAGVILAVFLFCRSQRINWVRFLDYVACATPPGLGLGRLANFVNGELWGRTTGSDFGVIFPGAGDAPRYPSQLFEAGLEGLLLFCVLQWLFWRTNVRLRPGILSGVFGLGYALCRIIVENFREPDAQLGYLFAHVTMGQLLSVPVAVAGAGFLAYGLARRPIAAAV